MDDRQRDFWPRVVALITGCALLGAVVGAVAGLVTGRMGNSIALGIGAGAVISIALIFLLPDRGGGQRR